MLGDGYIAQHIRQGYRDYIEQTSYKMYMSDLMRNVTQYFTGSEINRRWCDILEELDGTETPEEQTESEEEVKSRLLAKLNGREGA